MNIIILLVVGGILGWLASIVMRTDGQQGIFLNIIVGIVGAFLAGFIITPLIGGAPITSGASAQSPETERATSAAKLGPDKTAI